MYISAYLVGTPAPRRPQYFLQPRTLGGRRPYLLMPCKSHSKCADSPGVKPLLAVWALDFTVTA